MAKEGSKAAESAGGENPATEATTKPKKTIRQRISNFFSRVGACFARLKKRNKVVPAPAASASLTSSDMAVEEAVELALKKSLTCELDDTL